MRKKQLMIGVPTKDHPECIRIYLSRILDDARSYGIDIHIYDSSEDGRTEHIVKEKIENGFDNLYFHKYGNDNISFPNMQKVRDIFVDSGYEYVWLCGDGVMLNLDNVMLCVNEEMQKNRDLIIFNSLMDGYAEYVDPVKLIVEQWKALSLYGGTIYKGNLFSQQIWDKMFSLYPNNLHMAGVFDIFAERPMNVISIGTHFCIENPYKEESTWILGGRILQAVTDQMTSEVNKLPHIYDPVKEQVGRSFPESRGMLLAPNIWWLRATGNITPGKTVKYMKQLKKTTDTNYLLFLGGSFIPKKFARKVANIISYA